MEAAYLKLYRELKQQILSGNYACGERFMSKRAAAEEYGLSLVTVQHAYEILCDEGWLTARERSGFFVAYSAEGGVSVPRIPETPDPSPAEERVDSGLPFGIYSRAVRPMRYFTLFFCRWPIICHRKGSPPQLSACSIFPVSSCT